jgi:hypothetical protein
MKGDRLFGGWMKNVESKAIENKLSPLNYSRGGV